MPYLRKAADRGVTQIDWLDSRHSFSFGDYVDPTHRGFGPLRVINEDWITPDTGFGLHPHHDMEIITVMLAGQVRHVDSLGNEALITAGEIQRMSAGTGIRHSEWNPSKTETAHLLQIWIRPDEKGVEPSYAQQPIDVSQSGWTALVSPAGGSGPIIIHQQAWLWQGLFSADTPMPEVPEFKTGHGAWLQMISGELQSSVGLLETGDGVGLQPEEWSDFYVQLKPATEVKALLFALPMDV